MPEDLQKDPSSFFCVPESEFVKVFTSSGSTGDPKKAFFTKEDVDRVIIPAAAGGRALHGITNKDIIRLTFEVGYGTEIWGNSYFLDQIYGKTIGALIVAGSRLSIENELKILQDFKPTVFGDVSSRVNLLTKELAKLCDLKSLGVKKFFIGAEPTPNSMRRNIEKSWNADVFIGYGMTEISCTIAGECEKKNGMHISEMSYLPEVVDPNTGEQLEEGEVGEMVYTTLDRFGMPLIRYSSHDLGRILPGLCGCGLPLKRIEIKGRSDDLIPIGAGDNLFTWMFDEILFDIPEVIEYQVVFDKRDSLDLITIVVEIDKPTEEVKKKIIDGIVAMPEICMGIESSKTIAKPVVKFVKPNTFDRDSLKLRRLIDKRNLYD